MGKVSKHGRAIESPRWRIGQYEYRVSPTLKFTLTLGEYPYAMAHVGLPAQSDYAVYTVLPTLSARSEQPYVEECERLAAGYEHILAFLRFAIACGEPREPGCQCHLEAGDSPCRVHGEEEPDTHNADECALVFGMVCAHPDCARRDREIAAFKREMGAL